MVFSVIIPTFNRATVLLRAIDSVLRQPFQDFEIIVVDDGSTDNTMLLMENSDWQKVRYLHQENAGVCAARNAGARMAQGDYLIFLDSDDWLSENCLGSFANLIHEKNSKLVIGKVTFYNNDVAIVGEQRPKFLGTHYRHGLAGSFAIEKIIFKRLGGYDPKLSFAENTDFFLRVRLEHAIQIHEVATEDDEGVCVLKEPKVTRSLRYTNKKYQSVKYFIDKHRVHLEGSKRDFMNFNRVLGFEAFYNGSLTEARSALMSIICKYPLSIRTYFQYLLFLFPGVARHYYRLRNRTL